MNKENGSRLPGAPPSSQVPVSEFQIKPQMHVGENDRIWETEIEKTPSSHDGGEDMLLLCTENFNTLK